MSDSGVQFSKSPSLRGLSIAAGSLVGVGIAVGVPWVVLALGQSLGPHVLTIIVIGALACGALVSLTAVFFGLVIPEQVGGAWTDPKMWKEWARESRDWHERQGGDLGGRIHRSVRRAVREEVQGGRKRKREEAGR